MSDGRGRPCVYTPEAAKIILEGLAEGKSLRAICRENESVPSESTIRGWVVEDVEGFAAQYARSRDIGLDCRADALIEDAKAAKDAGLGRLSFDADRWYLSKLAPKRYGDKVALTGGDKDDAPIQTVTRIELVAPEPSAD